MALANGGSTLELAGAVLSAVPTVTAAAALVGVATLILRQLFLGADRRAGEGITRAAVILGVMFAIALLASGGAYLGKSMGAGNPLAPSGASTSALPQWSDGTTWEGRLGASGRG